VTSLQVSAVPHGSTGGSASSIGSRQTGINQRLAVFLAAFVALAPVPLGGARPLFWALSGVIIAGAVLLYALALWRKRESFRVSLGTLVPLIALWALLLVFLVVQAMPLGHLFGPIAFTSIEGREFSANSLSLAPGETLLMLVRMLGYGGFFFLALQAAANRDRAAQLGKWLCWITAAHALYGLVALTQFGDTLLFLEKWAYQGSATGTFVNRNSYATFLAIGLVLSTGFALRTLLNKGLSHLRKGQRSLAFQAAPMVVTALVILAALLATESRMGLFAGVSGTAVLVAVGFLKGRFRSRGLALSALVLVVLVMVVAFLLFSGGTLERLGSVERDSDVRLQLYAQVWDMIRARWLTGFGGGSFELAYPLFHREPVSPDLVWDRAHSTYLSLWSELGIFAGTLPMLIMVLMGFQAAFLVFKRENDWWLPLIALSTLAVIGLHSLVDFSMEMSGNVYLVLMVLALGIAQRRQSKRVPQRDHPAR
jgi:O-antigen ligase